MKYGSEFHIFLDMDETLLKGQYLDSFGPSDFLIEELLDAKTMDARAALIKGWNVQIKKDFAAMKRRHPKSKAKCHPEDYNRYMMNLMMEEKVKPDGWHVLWFAPADAIAVFPRPHVKKFLKEASALGRLCLCTTAVRTYAEAAVTQVLGAAGFFKEVFTRGDIYASPGMYPEKGWEWVGGADFVLVDDLPDGAAGLRDKMTFLGVKQGEDYSSHLIHAVPYHGWRKNDNVLIKDILPGLRKISSGGTVAVNVNNRKTLC